MTRPYSSDNKQIPIEEILSPMQELLRPHLQDSSRIAGVLQPLLELISCLPELSDTEKVGKINSKVRNSDTSIWLLHAHRKKMDGNRVPLFAMNWGAQRRGENIRGGILLSMPDKYTTSVFGIYLEYNEEEIQSLTLGIFSILGATEVFDGPFTLFHNQFYLGKVIYSDNIVELVKRGKGNFNDAALDNAEQIVRNIGKNLKKASK